jgi:hypothetical protein
LREAGIFRFDERGLRVGSIEIQLHKPVSKEALLKAIQTALMHAALRE